jgi:hypothetical protein
MMNMENTVQEEQSLLVPVTGPRVYAAIANVAGDLAVFGVAKDRKNSQQGYNFRGIDDMYNALAPLLSKYGLAIVPRVLAREQVERSTKTGGALFYTTVDVEFDFVSVHDGSKHTAKVFGEAMDSADKSTNKAMSAAYKYVVMQTFCIPTEGDNDADASHHEVAPRTQQAAQNQAPGAKAADAKKPAAVSNAMSEAQYDRIVELGKQLGYSKPAFVDFVKETTGGAFSKQMPAAAATKILSAMENMLIQQGAA